MKYFVTADPHYGHGNIIIYADRPFKDADEMNETMIKRYNERVKEDDLTFIVGDFCFKHPVSQDSEAGGRPLKAVQWLDRLNGQKIIIRGNHDTNNSTKTIIDSIHITYAGQRINMVHKPEHCDPRFAINLVGHVHTAWKFRIFSEYYQTISNLLKSGENIRNKESMERFVIDNQDFKDSNSIILNIGVDQNRFYPITLDEALGQIIRIKKGVLKQSVKQLGI